MLISLIAICCCIDTIANTTLFRWMVVNTVLEGLKLSSQTICCFCVRAGSIPQSIRAKIASFCFDNLSCCWFIYGNALYYTEAVPEKQDATIFPILFSLILIYGYVYMIKYAIEMICFCFLSSMWMNMEVDLNNELLPYLPPAPDPVLTKVLSPLSSSPNRN